MKFLINLLSYPHISAFLPYIFLVSFQHHSTLIAGTLSNASLAFGATLQESLQAIGSGAQDIADALETVKEGLEEIAGTQGTMALPGWLLLATETSNGLIVVTVHNRGFVKLNEKDEYGFEIFPGEHNLWIDNDNHLWGYDKESRLFKRSTITMPTQ